MFFNDAIPTKLANLARGTGEPYVAPVEEPLPYDEFDDASLVQEAGGKLVWDIEVYPNYFLIAFKSLHSGKVAFFELSPSSPSINHKKLYWIATNFQLIGFNSLQFDEPLLWLAYAGADLPKLNTATRMLIHENARSRDLEKAFDYTVRKTDHIDLIEVAPLRGSLKLYAARLHTRWMQELPYPPEQPLTQEQADFVKRYCVNDLDNTALVWANLASQLKLRESMSDQYGIDLRSKSDAQIAEAVICSEIKRITGKIPSRPKVLAGTVFRYDAPAWMRFQTPAMQGALKLIQSLDFVVQENGVVATPDALSNLTVPIGDGRYRMGIGGLHSSEECRAHREGADTILVDRDVASYYPAIILNNGYAPAHMGDDFLTVYQELVDARLKAKRSGDKTTADSLKITINGSFGKLGSPYSTLYAPKLLIQVTLTGQLALLMLIEALETAGIAVVSANTDGIVIKCPRTLVGTMDAVVAQWESDTNFITEASRYRLLASRDVNAYTAITDEGKIKRKGYLANPWLDKGMEIFRFHKNPEATIISEAVGAYLANGTPIEETINDCADVIKFVSVRNPKTGAYKDGVYLGKVIRWYYKLNEFTPITTPTGNKVPKSEGAWPLMILPKEVPLDINRSHYIQEAYAVLREIGVLL